MSEPEIDNEFIPPLNPMERPELPRTLLILYGSETGNSQDVAEELGRCGQRLRFQTTVEEMNSIEIVRPVPHSRFFPSVLFFISISYKYHQTIDLR